MATRTSLVYATLLLVFTHSGNALFDCAVECNCYYYEHDWVMDCSESELTFIPEEAIESKVNKLYMNKNHLKEMDPIPNTARIETLKLSENYLTKIYNTTFAGLLTLKDLDLSSNMIHFIDTDAFVENVGLRSVDLEGNLLAGYEGSFIKSRKLLSLNLANNRMTKISTLFFENTRALITLDLSRNELGFIGRGVFDQLKNLEHLSLNYCSLTHIHEDAFRYLQNLMSLELSGNSLKGEINWVTLFGQLPRLEHLDLRNSSISNLPSHAFIKNTLLKSLVLAENDLTDFGVAIALGANLSYLDTVDLSYCRLKGPLNKGAFAKACQLRSLDLSGNHLSDEDFAAVLLPLTSLEKLSLRDCGLTRLPNNTFQGLENLQELDVSRNPLHNDFLKILSPLETLTHFDMGYCGLKTIDAGTFLNMSELKTLVLSGNDLTNVKPGLFGNLTHLELVALEDCGLSHLNQSMFSSGCEYPALRELRLSGNPVKFPNAGSIFPPQLSGLKDLDLSNCKLDYVPADAFVNTPELRRLSLHHNRLKNYGVRAMRFLRPLTELRTLDVSYNMMTSTEPERFVGNPQLTSLNLIGNPWICDCYVLDMWQWVMLNKTNIGVLVGSTRLVDVGQRGASGKGKVYRSLQCVTDSKVTPVKNGVLGTPIKKLGSGVSRTWARYVREAYCPVSLELIKPVQLFASMRL